MIAIQLALSHHEKWDGTGYPNGTDGNQIPLSGRIMALADVYDALRSERGYKSSIGHDKSRDIILDGRGTHFDPDVVGTFLLKQDDFLWISNTLGDTMPQEALGELEAEQ